MTKKCTKCGKVKDVTEFYHSKASSDGFYPQCKECKNAYYKAYCKTRSGRETSRRARRKQKYKCYGLNSKSYLELFRKQNGKCVICGVSHLELNRELSVDHNHTTGHIRGLLCGNCNRMLGMAGDNPIILDNARQYLEHYNKNQSESKQQARTGAA